MNELGTKKIETERLILRRFNINDVDQMYNNWANDELTCRYLTWKVHGSKEVTRNFILSQISNYDDPYYFNWVVERKVDETLIGSISVVHMSLKNSICEIGYCYGSGFWNKGYATEALRAVIEFLLKEVEITLIELNHISINPARLC
ncbi:MAG: acetyltransferase family [Haloplasmataceae bacterium]|nr:acetyltransferase family [Haloplasmataceae bacterium]